MYRIFKRTWWRKNPNWPNGLEPCLGRKRTVKTVETQEEAREFCQLHNRISLPKSNPLSLKYEFEHV